MRRVLLTIAAIFLIALPAASAFAQPGGEAPSQPEQSEESDESEARGQADDAEREQAEEAPAADKADEPDDAQPASSATAESKASQERTIPGGTLAVISYMLLWLMTLGFVWFTARRQKALAGELETLEGRMDRVLGDIEDEV